MKRLTEPMALLVLALFGVPATAGQITNSDDDGTLPTIAEKTRSLRRLDGFLTLHLDEKRGTVWLEVPPPDGPRGVAVELLYTDSLRTGLGSNPVGLDRSQQGPTRWVALRRVGPRVLLEQLNPRFRALSDDEAERQATAESFATSVLWGEKIAALDPDGRALVDLGSFVVRDAHDVETRLRDSEQGEFTLDPERSAVDAGRCLAFPDNVELEAVLTYGGKRPGGQVSGTAPSPDSVTLVQHHSFVRLPDDGYRPRRFDPRAASYAVDFHDYATDLKTPISGGWIARHRLQKTDSSKARSRVREPIVFYVDPGVPEPVRGALVEGAGWWAEAFDEAGFIDAFRVEVLPPDVDPLDVRYSVIQWVHRSTRGWSYGGGVIDPRTGEILKGHVLLGSLRVRQDRLLFEGLAGTGKTGSGADDDPIQLALARIRQLSAHEVGHALGFTHNFAASTYADRASVMDYPAPRIRIEGGDRLDFSEAYGVGVGAWDRHAVRWAYSEFAPGTDEEAALQRIVREGLDAGYIFLSDADARPAGASDPRANLWDNGDDPVQALEVTMRVRRLALDAFGEDNLLPGVPLAHLQEVLAPLYFHHRFQLDAAVKVVGGMEYSYAVRGDGQFSTRVVAAERQHGALLALLGLLDPAELDLPDAVVELLAPRPFGESPNREMFPGATSPAFDTQAAAAAAATMVIDGLLQPQRLGRVEEFHRRDASTLGVTELLDALVERVFDRPTGDDRRAALQRLVRSVVVDRLMLAHGRSELRPSLRAEIEAELEQIADKLRQRSPSGAAERQDAFLTREIDRFLDDPGRHRERAWSPPPAPPGSPIGSATSCPWDSTWRTAIPRQ